MPRESPRFTVCSKNLAFLNAMIDPPYLLGAVNPDTRSFLGSGIAAERPATAMMISSRLFCLPNGANFISHPSVD